MKSDGLKSINAKNLEQYTKDYFFIDIPSVKKRVFMESNYNIMFKELEDAVANE